MQNVREQITNLLMNGVDRAYDTDLAAAFLVKDAMRKRGFRFKLIQWRLGDADDILVEFERFGDHPSGAAAFGEAEGTNIPRTICEAALDALEAEREHGAAADDARAMSGEYIMPPQVAALLRSGGTVVPKAPERNWDALIEAARRKPRTDDDVLREKFGGGDAEVVGAASTGARHESVGLASGKSPCAPSSEFCTKHNGIVVSNGVSCPTGYTLTYYDTNTGGPGSIVLGGGGAATS